MTQQQATAQQIAAANPTPGINGQAPTPTPIIKQETAQKPLPSIGRIVHYHPNEKINMSFKGQKVCPAIITKVDGNEMVNLTVFGDGHMMPTCLNSVKLKKDKDQTDCWSWPPRN